MVKSIFAAGWNNLTPPDGANATPIVLPDSISDMAEAPLWALAFAQQALAWPASQQQSPDTQQQMYQLILQLAMHLEQGHTCMPTPEIRHPLVAVLPAAPGPSASLVPHPLVWQQGYLYFWRQWKQELELATAFKRLLEPLAPVLSAAAPFAEGLNDAQQQALAAAFRHRFVLITGGPGTGKTFTLARIIQALHSSNPDCTIRLAAPTGKAAQRMQQALQAQLQDSSASLPAIEAQTVHRLLELGRQPHTAYHHQHHPLLADVIVVDEASMLDLDLASQLFNAIGPQTRVILLGDMHQLAAVEAGAVLADLQQLPHIRPVHINLVESRRFDARQAVGQLAQAVLKADLPAVQSVLYPFTLSAATSVGAQVRYMELANSASSQQHHVHSGFGHHTGTYDALWQGYLSYATAVSQLKATPSMEQLASLYQNFEQYRILCAMRGGELGTIRINREMGQRLQQAVTGEPSPAGARVRPAGQAGQWYTGQPVMLTHNDYRLGLSNGDTGIVYAETDGQQITGWMVYFPGLPSPIPVSQLAADSLETAFAITIHKSQGSEFDHVAVVIDPHAIRLLGRELLYTGLTRCRTRLDIFSTRQAIETAVLNPTQRLSGVRRQFLSLPDSSVSQSAKLIETEEEKTP